MIMIGTLRIFYEIFLKFLILQQIFFVVYYDIIQLHIVSLLHDHVGEAELVADTENLKISRHE